MDERVVYQFRKLISSTFLKLSELYEDHGLELRTQQSEYWYLRYVWEIFFRLLTSASDWLDPHPGEVSSRASSTRKNIGRELGTRQQSGSRTDRLIVCKKAKHEIGIMDAGKKDEGDTGTKILTDGVKISKVMKDTFDKITQPCRLSYKCRTQLVVYGLLISGLRVEFISIRFLG
ncbi:hypothetical protein BGZ76_004779, partial [Entomortierella beljakovae]